MLKRCPNDTLPYEDEKTRRCQKEMSASANEVRTVSWINGMTGEKVVLFIFIF